MGNTIHLADHGLSRAQVFDSERLYREDLGFQLAPSFSFDETDPVLVIGSCFAVEILKAMTERGFDATGADLGLQYNAPSMLQQLRWATGAPIESRSLIPITDSDGRRRVFDPCVYRRETCADVDEAVSARLEQASRLGAALRRARVVVLTFGLVELWRDEDAGVYLNVTPPAPAVAAPGNRYRCVRLTHAQNLAAMTDMFALIRSANPSARVVATISPVPLAATFTGSDVLIANCYSKSTLRSALTEASDAANGHGRPWVDYFPSYELATLSDRPSVWRTHHVHGDPDGRHVRPEFIRGVILPLFLDAYAGSARTKTADSDLGVRSA